MLDETDLTNDYDRLELHGGPVDRGGRLHGPVVHAVDDGRAAGRGVPHAALQRRGLRRHPHRLPRPGRSVRTALVTTDHLRDAGRAQLRAPDRRAVATGRRRRRRPHRAVGYARYVLKHGSSLYLPPMYYDEVFATYQDNFLPFARTPAGSRCGPPGHGCRAPLPAEPYTPYWDPECGVWVDVMVGGGAAEFDRLATAWGKAAGELAAVQNLPDWTGPAARDVRWPAAGWRMGRDAGPRPVLRPRRRHAVPRVRPRRAAGQLPVGRQRELRCRSSAT